MAEGTYSAGDIADRLLARHGIFHSDTYRNLDWMFERGLLHDEPPAPVRSEELVQLGGRA